MTEEKKDGLRISGNTSSDMDNERDVAIALREKLGQVEYHHITPEIVEENQKLVPEDMILAAGMPNSFGMVHTKFMSSFIGMIQGAPWLKHIIWADQGPLHSMRNNLIMSAMEKGATHLLMVDTDMVLPPFLIAGLARHKQPVVSALCFKRYPPYSPTLYMGEPKELFVMTKWPEGLVKVTATGCAAMLIDLAVFANLDFPWFEFKEDKDGKHIGEDIQFCYRCKEKEIPVFVDTTVECAHIAQVDVNTVFYEVMNKVLTINMEHKAP